jgi:hypothetical protein
VQLQFEHEVSPVRRRRAPVPQVVVVLLVALVAVAIAKPWAGSSPGLGGPSGSPSAIAAASDAGDRTVAPPSVAASSAPVGSSTSVADVVPPFGQASYPPGAVSLPTAEQITLLVSTLAQRGGAWGVGTGGSGPRMIRDDPWTDWKPVEPVDTGPSLGPDVPTAGLCAGTPILDDRPWLVALTVPPGLAPDWQAVGWWTDGTRFANLGGTIHQVSPPGNRTITYLQRTDRAPWPDGRYEFQVVSAEHTMSMTVCLERT